MSRLVHSKITTAREIMMDCDSTDGSGIFRGGPEGSFSLLDSGWVQSVQLRD